MLVYQRVLGMIKNPGTGKSYSPTSFNIEMTQAFEHCSTRDFSNEMGRAGYVLAILALYVCRGLWMSRKSARLSFRKPALNGHLHGKIIELNSRFSKDMCHHPEGNPDFFSLKHIQLLKWLAARISPGDFVFELR